MYTLSQQYLRMRYFDKVISRAWPGFYLSGYLWAAWLVINRYRNITPCPSAAKPITGYWVNIDSSGALLKRLSFSLVFSWGADLTALNLLLLIAFHILCMAGMSWINMRVVGVIQMKCFLEFISALISFLRDCGIWAKVIWLCFIPLFISCFRWSSFFFPDEYLQWFNT